jgi:hypothetical protein
VKTEVIEVIDEAIGQVWASSTMLRGVDVHFIVDDFGPAITVNGHGRRVVRRVDPAFLTGSPEIIADHLGRHINTALLEHTNNA